MANYLNKFQTSLLVANLSGSTYSRLISIPNINVPFYMAFDPENTNGHYEIVNITNKSGNKVHHLATNFDHGTNEKIRIIIPAETLTGMYASIATAEGISLPAGIIRSFAGSVSPSGWVLCNGATYLKVGTYANLFAAIGTTYGFSDADNFSVPDTRDLIVMGYNSGDANFNALGKTGGSKTISLSHNHSGVYHYHYAGANTGQGNSSTSSGGDRNTTHVTWSHLHYGGYDTGYATTPVTTTATQTPTILMPSISVNMIIKI